MGQEASKMVGHSIRNAWVPSSNLGCGTDKNRHLWLSIGRFSLAGCIAFCAVLGGIGRLWRTKVGTWLQRRRQRKIARFNYIAGTAWLAFERGQISRDEFLRIQRDVRP
jgi:hypothetical protein